MVEGHLAEAPVAQQMPSRVFAMRFVFGEPDDTGFNEDMVRARRVRGGQRRRHHGDPQGRCEILTA